MAHPVSRPWRWAGKSLRGNLQPWNGSISNLPVPTTAPDQLLLQGRTFVIPPYVTRREKKQEFIELRMFEVPVTDRRRQMSKAQLPRLWTGRREFGTLGPKEIPRTGLLLGGYDYIINKEADRAEVVNKHFVRKLSQCTQVR